MEDEHLRARGFWETEPCRSRDMGHGGAGVADVRARRRHVRLPAPMFGEHKRLGAARGCSVLGDGEIAALDTEGVTAREPNLASRRERAAHRHAMRPEEQRRAN